MISALIQKGAEMCLEAAGDRDGQAVANKSFQFQLKNAITMLSPRVSGKPIRLLSQNSAFNASRYNTWGFR
jgi:hypothetical protein